MNKLTFPQGFLWGSATAAHQIEGNNVHNDWWEWEHSGQRATELGKQNKNASDYYSGIACDSYNRYEEDFDIAKSLNQNAHRLSIEWSRIEPKQGEYDHAEVEHYRKVLHALKSRGMKTFVTMHHYTVPAWFAQIGGFEKRENIKYFLNFVGKVTAELKNLINFVCVINEPEIYATFAYGVGKFPPQKHGIRRATLVGDHLAEAHVKSYKIIKAADPTIQVGTAQGISYRSYSLMMKLFTGYAESLAYKRFLHRVINHTDFLGLQYYSHQTVTFNFRPPFIHTAPVKKGRPVNDLGWEIYPEGIFELLRRLRKYGKPIYITENGTADAKDAFREKFIRDHLRMVYRAIKAGADVRGYFHWSLIDNFEWAEGFAPRFGLVEIDRENNLARKIRPSAHVYAEICKNNFLESE